MTENPPTESRGTPISTEEFEKRDEALSEALDKLERDVPPPKTKPEPIGGMF